MLQASSFPYVFFIRFLTKLCIDNHVSFVSSSTSDLNVLLPKNGLKYAFTASVSSADFSLQSL
jgi:hypothetical protein